MEKELLAMELLIKVQSQLLNGSFFHHTTQHVGKIFLRSNKLYILEKNSKILVNLYNVFHGIFI